MSYKELIAQIDPNDYREARRLAFFVALKTISDLCNDDEEFVGVISNRVNSVHRYIDETQWEILYTMDTGEDMPDYMADFLGLNKEII